MDSKNIKQQKKSKLRTEKSILGLLCFNCNRNFEILGLEIYTIRFQNFNWIIFASEKQPEYEYEYYLVLKKPPEYEYYSVWKYLPNTSTNIAIRCQLFEYYLNTELFAHLWFYSIKILYEICQILNVLAATDFESKDIVVSTSKLGSGGRQDF